MKVFYTLRRLAPVVAVISLAFMDSCDPKTQKWGCPNHLEAATTQP
jgi:hypothetical protein